MSPAGRSGRPDAPLHLVFVPFLARSHFAPLAAKAADACGQRVGATATTAAIVTTPHFAALAPPCVPVHVAGFRCPGGHEDFSQLPDDEASSAPAFFSAAEAALAPALAAVLRAQDGPAAVVSDAVLYWVPRVARECGAPHVTFHTIGTFAASAMVAVHLHRPEAFLDPFVVPGGFPRHVKLRRAQINEEALAHLPLFRAAEAQSYAVAFNSFAALEANFAAYYQSQLAGRPKKVFLVGPALAAAASPRTVTGGAERDPILQWLDGRPAGSVVYAVRAGVPLATWPLRAEQFVNEAFLVEVLRVGVRVREVAREEAGLEAVVPAGAVTRAVGRLMGDGQGEAEAVAGRRARARELGSAARAAVAEGGSSCGDWARLVEELKALHGRDSDPQV
ncbi:UDP-glycosyltransferase 73B4-like [Panicum miliaceum]|uniref:UDP-glycosyltransferase 73B4-like n=1 Tax=Panicum miliaceum TaxID=4540 RepID=A0A3L6SBT6_PANMI|nr:UDP-glycosyltransferase 73B4-like [Panicum miliaceum]